MERFCSTRGGFANEALREFWRWVQLKPEYAAGTLSWAGCLPPGPARTRRIPEFFEAIRCGPNDADAHHSLGVALLARGRLSEAIAEFGAEAQLKPADASVP